MHRLFGLFSAASPRTKAYCFGELDPIQFLDTCYVGDQQRVLIIKDIGPQLLTLRFENKEKRRKVTKCGPNIF